MAGRPSRNVGPPTRFTPSQGPPEIRFKVGRLFKERPRGQKALVSGLPKAYENYDSRKLSDSMTYEARKHEISETDGPVPRLPEDSILITELPLNARGLLADLCKALSAILGQTGQPDEAKMDEFEELVSRSQGMILVMIEMQWAKIETTLEEVIPLYKRLVAVGRLAQLIREANLNEPRVVSGLRKLAEQVGDCHLSSLEVISNIETFELRAPVTPKKVTRAATLAAAAVPLQLPTVPSITIRSQSASSPTTPLGVTWGSGSQPGPSGSQVQAASYPRDGFSHVSSHQNSRSDLPPGFHDTSVPFTQKSARDYITKNPITVFIQDDDNPLGQSFRDFWEEFSHMFHRYSYDTFSVADKLFALELYTLGSAQDTVKAYKGSGIPGYTECIRELHLRYGQTGATISEIRTQLTQLAPAGFSQAAVDKFFNEVSRCRVKLITLGEDAKDAAHQVAVHIFSKLPPSIMSTFTSLVCGTNDFREAVRLDPEGIHYSLKKWAYMNLKAIEEAGSRSYGADAGFVQNSIFAATTSGGQSAGAAPKTPEKRETNSRPATPRPPAPQPRTPSKQDSASTPGGGEGETSDSTPKKRIQNFSCNVCQTNAHHWAQCPEPVENRKAKLRESNRCFNCTGGGHGARACRSRFRCKNCVHYGITNSRHHTSICDKDMVDFRKKDGQGQGGTPLKRENPDEINNPESAKRMKTQSALATLEKEGGVTPQMSAEISQRLGLQDPGLKKF